MINKIMDIYRTYPLSFTKPTRYSYKHFCVDLGFIDYKDGNISVHLDIPKYNHKNNTIVFIDKGFSIKTIQFTKFIDGIEYVHQDEDWKPSLILLKPRNDTSGWRVFQKEYRTMGKLHRKKGPAIETFDFVEKYDLNLVSQDYNPELGIVIKLESYYFNGKLIPDWAPKIDYNGVSNKELTKDLLLKTILEFDRKYGLYLKDILEKW